jgi:hypothetical protein
MVLKGRTGVICFDADTYSKPNVMRAMIRFGRWLKYKGMTTVYDVIVPGEVKGVKVNGVDDYFAAGGTLRDLREVATTKPPNPDLTDGTFSDTMLADTITGDVLAERFIWVSGLGWLEWSGKVWEQCTDVTVGEAVRQYVLERFGEALDALKADPNASTVVARWLEGNAERGSATVGPHDGSRTCRAQR